jgi:cation transport regulator ChaC
MESKMEQQTKTNNEQLAIVTAEYNPYDHRNFDYQVKRLMHYKAAASYAVKVIEDPKNYWFTAWGSPMWNTRIGIYDDTKTEIAGFGNSTSKYWDAIESISSLYAAVMYVFAAMREARQRVIAIGLQEMTPAEIEKEFGLSRGTVRKYIFDNRQALHEVGVIRQADKRTILCKRGWAICRWGNKK